MARPWPVLGCILALSLLGSASGLAQPVARRHAPGRLGAAVVQGSSDEVVLPVTELRVRRSGARSQRTRVCMHPPVELVRLRSRDAPRWSGPLTDCAGRPTLQAMAALSLLARTDRDGGFDLAPALVELRRRASSAGLALADEPQASRARTRGRETPLVIERDARTHDPVIDLAPTARVLHPRLVQLLQAVVDHFPGHAVEIISGFRRDDSVRATSRHAHARALDFRLAGVPNEALRDFARTLPDAGVGYYPNSVFVHLDVRDPDEGSAFWADYSGPGERPRYGHWPPTDRDVTREVDYLVTHSEHELASAREHEGPPAATPAAPDP